MKKQTHEQFENKVIEKFNNKVILLSEYIGSLQPIKIKYICDKHGEQFKTLNAKNIFAKSFQPCKECEIENKSKIKSNDKNFLYSKLKRYVEDKGGKLITQQWTRSKDTYEIVCEQGHKFKTTADSLMNKPQWCPYCCGRKGDFESRYLKIIKDKNGTLLNKYINSETYLKVKCDKHDYVWDILPNNLLKGRWCPICNLPYSEKVVYDYLKNNKINIKVQYTFDDLTNDNGEKLRFDFAIFQNQELKFLLEIDDNEHRYNTNQPRRIKARERDNKKDKYCVDNSIKLVRLIYDTYKKQYSNYEWYYNYIQENLCDIIKNIN